MHSDLLTSVRQAADVVEPLVAGVTAEQRQWRTPCPSLDLISLTAHLIGGLSGMAGVAEGEPLRFDNDPELVNCDAAAELHAATQRMLDDFSAPGMIDRTFQMPWGPATGAQLLGFELTELIVHGWDIARSSRQSVAFDDGMVAAVLENARTWVDAAARTPQLFGPEIPADDDAPVLDQLVAFLGRDPAWTSDTSTAAP